MADVFEYKCPCCSGGIKFNTQAQKMKCPYCDTEFELETLKEYDASLGEKQDEFNWDIEFKDEFKIDETNGMRVYSCQSCGGEIIGDETLGASKCPYCDNPVIMMGQFSGDLKPNYVIPFKYDKKAAKDALFNHFKGKRLLPKAFKSENHIDEIKGVYVPFWLFDSEVEGEVRYKATKIRFWSDSKYDYTETSFYSIIREGQMAFDKIPVDGSSQMPDDLMESVEPFDFSEAQEFQTAYLSGFLADRYDVTSEESIDRANTRVKASLEDSFKDSVVGYDSVITENSNIRVTKGSTSYALYPVWILNTTYKDQKYLFAMNGQTGKMVGDLPLDKGLLFKYGISILAIATIILEAIVWLVL